MSATNSFDVIFVGAGHNALIAASYLVKEGRSVCLLDLGPDPGGWVRTEELTLPGFVHDTFSALHPIFVGGPVFAELGTELADYGLTYVQGNVSTGASFPDGRSAVIETNSDALAAELDRLGERDAWTQLMADVSPQLGSLVPLLGMDLNSPEAVGLLDELNRHSASHLPFSTLLTSSGLDLLGARFSSEELIMAWLPWLLHIGLSPWDAGGALWSVLLMATLGAGNPTPIGGSGRLAEALAGLVTAHGGVIRTGVEVDAIVTECGRATGVRTVHGEHLTATEAVVATTTPEQLYGRLLGDAPGIPESARVQASRYRYRRGCFQLNVALSARPHFADSRLDGGGGINVGRGLTELVTSVRQAEDGLLPANPSISWHEATAVDPERAPAGRAVVRLQVLDAPLHPAGDAAGVIRVDGGWTASVAEQFADRVITEAAQHISGLEQMVIGRHILTPTDLSRISPNAGPGDHASGHNALSQAFTQRPIPAHRGGYATVVPDLYLIGAATWPGPGVGGTSGRAVARRLLNDNHR
ncbi:NAD(P)/FAD-dependent oxidoreductase [Nocardia sp. NPDC005998]|uniref:phytoene desaturase family protein n=1 Tax=Nocardia sp. NPDC005998 TaxID=3156894 RepID=UPI0033B8B5B7